MSFDVDTGGGKGGKKSLVAEVNVVPFIDLMSCLISFLLISAVWTQLARINVSQKVPGKQSQDQTPPPLVKKDLKVILDDQGYTGELDTGPGFQQQWHIPKTSTGCDPSPAPCYNINGPGGLIEKITAWSKNPDYQDKDDIAVGATNTVKYDDIVGTMDAIVPFFSDIALTDESH
jgi:biopolymer transport protein ExbD